MRIQNNVVKHFPGMNEFTYDDSPNKSTRLSKFYILYGMHLRGTCELKNLGKVEIIGVHAKDFSIAM